MDPWHGLIDFYFINSNLALVSKALSEGRWGSLRLEPISGFWAMKSFPIENETGSCLLCLQ